jgi:hypothetical protein
MVPARSPGVNPRFGGVGAGITKASYSLSPPAPLPFDPRSSDGRGELFSLLSPLRRSTTETETGPLAEEQLRYFGIDPATEIGEAMSRFARRLYDGHGANRWKRNFFISVSGFLPPGSIKLSPELFNTESSMIASWPPLSKTLSNSVSRARRSALLLT